MGRYGEAIAYADKALALSEKIMNDIVKILEDEKVGQSDREFFSE